MEGATYKHLRAKTVAVGSGKGGVGKSTTSVNIAIVAAKRGYRVALIDLDPLSNIATILDVSTDGLSKVARRVATGEGSLSAFTLPLFPRVDLLFPHPQLDIGESAKLRSQLFVRSAEELAAAYDVVICDMPAGIGHEENLGFLPYMGILLVVTNPEPTSHVSAGGYIRVALEIQPDLRILLWHNRYKEVLPGRFSPTDVIGNYNLYVDDELRISADAAKQIGHITKVPDDPSLNLLQQSIAAETQVLGKLLDTTSMLRRVIVSQVEVAGVDDTELREELRYFINAYTGKLDVRAMMGELDTYLGSDIEPGAAAEAIKDYLANPLVPTVHAALQGIGDAIEAIASRSRLFWQSGDEGLALKNARRDVFNLINRLVRSKKAVFERNLGGMLICYVALLLIMDSRPVRRMISNTIPSRSVDGRRIRNRRLLIRNLVVRNDDYHRRYFRLVKTLYPVLMKQVDRLTATHGWQKLLLRSPDGEVNKNAYLKLLTHTLHDVLHAGLGVFVGFRYNTAGRAIEDGAKRLLKIVSRKL